ncbi:uncharacterized protein [Dermacentor albipictus]|uniref:uncharacterized protein isoform X1 n=1 Tax=Dermacentor albipictus TaxID=60249 RepID=UPI0038FBE960
MHTLGAFLAVLAGVQLISAQGAAKCKLPPDEGRCDEKLQRFFFNVTSGFCELFTYNGCDGNQNNFAAYKECIDECQKMPSTAYVHRSLSRPSGCGALPRRSPGSLLLRRGCGTLQEDGVRILFGILGQLHPSRGVQNSLRRRVLKADGSRHLPRQAAPVLLRSRRKQVPAVRLHRVPRKRQQVPHPRHVQQDVPSRLRLTSTSAS